MMAKSKHTKENPHPDNVGRERSDTRAVADPRLVAAVKEAAERIRARTIARIADETKASQRAVANQIEAAKRITEPALPIAARIAPVGYTGPRGGTSTRRERRDEMHPAFAACLVPWNVPDCDLTPDERRARREKEAGR